ncbi:hydrogenase maturation protease [Streptomyces sp. NPDC046942]|uniref:hydrogenase maturation protease n=1 Tax=Streptomyces sp. NPDC046942 TaxID=3155137 RepID=UPI00340278AE
MSEQVRVAVIGVGNDFRRDDGVGWAVVARLTDRAAEQPLPSGTRLMVSDGEPVRLISMWEGTDLTIVIDAAQAQPPHPGRIHRVELDREQLPHESGETSSHGLGLGDAAELARRLDRLPHRLIVYAVEGADAGLGTGLSAPVAAAVGPLAQQIAEEITQYARTATGSSDG